MRWHVLLLCTMFAVGCSAGEEGNADDAEEDGDAAAGGNGAAASGDCARGEGVAADAVVLCFSGAITTVADDEGVSGAATGDVFVATLTFDASASDQDPSDAAGVYRFDAPPNQLVVDVAGQVFATADGPLNLLIDLQNDAADRLVVRSLTNTGPAGAGEHSATLDLSSTDNTAIDTDELPGSVDVERWETRLLALTEATGSWTVRGSIDSAAVGD